METREIHGPIWSILGILYKQIPGAVLFNIICACIGCFDTFAFFGPINVKINCAIFLFCGYFHFSLQTPFQSPILSHCSHAPTNSYLQIPFMAFSSTLKIVSNVLFLNWLFDACAPF